MIQFCKDWEELRRMLLEHERTCIVCTHVVNRDQRKINSDKKKAIAAKKKGKAA